MRKFFIVLVWGMGLGLAALFTKDIVPQIVSTDVDGVVLVVKSGDTTEDELNEAIDAVRRAGGNLCGTVLNDLNMKSVKYAYKYKYGGKYGYKYSYSESYEAR